MTTVTGRFAEARLYLRYALSPFRPGVTVPTFHEPRQFTWDLDIKMKSPDFTILIEEGRRQYDRQHADLEKIRGRAAALVTICLGELAALSAGASRVFTHPLWISLWLLSLIAVLLALGGAVALWSSQAQFTSINTMGLAAGKPPVQKAAALSYAKLVGAGEQTIATRITVFRDAILLAVLGGILYAAVWPVATLGTADQVKTPIPVVVITPTSSVSPFQKPTGGSSSCPTCTPSSPSLPTASPKTSVPSPPPPSPHP